MSATHDKTPGVPDAQTPFGFTRRAETELIHVGDIIADCEGKWRGPVPPGWSGLGRTVKSYTTSRTPGITPAALAVAWPIKHGD